MAEQWCAQSTPGSQFGATTTNRDRVGYLQQQMQARGGWNRAGRGRKGGISEWGEGNLGVVDLSSTNVLQDPKPTPSP